MIANKSIAYSGNIFNDVKQIPLVSIFERYSPNPIIKKYGKHKTSCPFHSEDDPSLSLKGERWKCFGCQENGDSIDFVSKLYGLSSLDAAKLIAKDFNITLNDEPLTGEQKEKIRKKREQQQLLKLWKHHVECLAQRLAETRRTLWSNLPKLPNGEAKEFTLKMIDQYLDILEAGTFNAQQELIESGSLEGWLT